MQLKGNQYAELQEALEGAYPSVDRLYQMVRFKLDENLNKIANTKNLSDAVFELIAWAEAQGKIEELVRGAHERNSGHSGLKAFAEKFLNLPITENFTQARIPLQRPPRVEHFTGRENELRELLDALQQDKVVTLCGPGGIGKSALAIEAIWSLFPDNKPPDAFPDGIIYHNFYRDPDTTSALREMVRAFGEDIVQGNPATVAQRVLAGRNVLLIFDGAEKAYDLKPLLEIRNGCGLLITTRNRQQAQGKRIDMTPLPEAEGVKLLQAWAPKQTDDQRALRKIYDLVGGLPFALRLVGHYLTQTDEYADEYLIWLQKKPLQALDHGETGHQSLPILLKKNIEQVGESAQKSLAVVGMLAFAPFDEKMLAAVLQLEDFEVRQKLGKFVRYGLLVRGDDKLYEVSHALVYTYAREFLSVTGEDEERWLHYLFQIIQEATSKPDALPIMKSLHPHLLTALDKIQAIYVQNEALKRQQMIDFVEVLNQYWQATYQYGYQTRWLKEAAECASYLGQPLRQARLLRARVRALYFQARVEEAKEDCLLSLSLVENTPYLEDIAEGYKFLANLYGRSGFLQEAINSCEKSLEIWKKLDNKFQIASLEDNLATTYERQGRMNLAYSFYKRSLEYWQSHSHPEQLALALSNFGYVSYELGKAHEILGLDDFKVYYQDAITKHQEALTINQDLNSPPGIARSLMNLAWLYLACKNDADAQVALNKSLKCQKDGELTTYLAETYRALTEVAIQNNDLTLATSHAEQALNLASGHDPAQQATAKRVLGKIKRLSGAYALADEYFQSSLQELKEMNYLFEMLLTWQELQRLYEEQGLVQESQKAELEMLQIVDQMGIMQR